MFALDAHFYKTDALLTVSPRSNCCPGTTRECQINILRSKLIVVQKYIFKQVQFGGILELNFSLFFFVRLLSISMCNLTERNLFENLKFITEFVTKLIGFDILNVICILILVLNLNSFFHGSMIFKALKHSSKIRDLCSMKLPVENTTKFAVQMKI